MKSSNTVYFPDFGVFTVFFNQSTANYALRANLRVAKSISRLAARGVLAANWVGLS